MFIDYLTVMLLNLVAGFFLLALYALIGVYDVDQRRWAAGFGIVGVIGLATGLHMTLTWPLPGSFNIAFGETELLFGVLFLLGAIALAFNRSLFSVAIYAFFVGIAAIEIGARIIDRGFTQQPVVAGLGFILSGLAAIFLFPILFWFTGRPVRIGYAVIALAAALIWAIIGYGAFWTHLVDFMEWTPPTLRM